MSKKPDYLTLCSIAAQKAGTSYGKYMAMHGYHPPIQADVEDVEAPQGISKICPQCGKEFTQGKIKQKIYCSLECQKAHVQRAAQRRYRDRKNEESDPEKILRRMFAKYAYGNVPEWFASAVSATAYVLSVDKGKGIECISVLHTATERAPAEIRMTAQTKLLMICQETGMLGGIGSLPVL